MEQNNQQKPGSTPNSPKPEDKNPGRNMLGMGMQIVAQVLVGVFAGVWLDKHFQTQHSIFTIILSVLMIIVALYQFIRQSIKN
jgi:F0F1-type ATP synthase assembly protein I